MSMLDTDRCLEEHDDVKPTDLPFLDSIIYICNNSTVIGHFIVKKECHCQ